MKKFKFKFLLLFPVIFFVVIATYFIFTASYPIVFADPAEFVVGDGTVDNPYQVSNCEQLQLIGTSTNLSLNFVLTNDIDCSQTSSWNPLYGASAVDIGAANAGTVYQIPNAPLQPGSVTVKVSNITRTTGFVIDHEAGTVTFDDLPSTLYGVSTSRRVTVDYTSINPIYYRGFNPIGVNTSAFTGRINGNGFKILDLFIYRPTTNYVGIFGYAGSGAQISNLGMLGGNITGYDYTGGIVGYSASSSTVSKSFVNGIQVTGYYHVGGLVGYNNTNGVITESYSINFRVLPISSGSRYVGGLVGTNIGSISNSYTRGILLGGTYQGGFAGRSTGSISNSFSASAIDDNGCAIGFGGNGTTNVTNSFWDTSVSTCASSYGLVPGTTTQALQTLSTFTDAGWDFSSTWSFDENKNNGYPYLINNDTGIDPIIEIDSVEDLQNIANNPGARFIQTADIDASSTASWNSGAGFLPIPIFYGQYEGNGFTITNLTINRPDTYYIGIFAQNRGVIRNMKIADSSFTGDYYTGSIAGFNSGTLYRSKSYRLNDSSNQVTGDYYTGGLVGQNSATGVITQGYAVANVIAQVSGSRYIGGLVGSNLGSISDCYARGSVSSGSFQGGFAGSSTGSISNSFSASVVGVAAFSGGFAGHGTVNVSGSFWDVSVSGYDTSYGGVGTTTSVLKTLSTFTDAGWSFDNVWHMDPDGLKNDGYPYLNPPIIPAIEIDSVEDLQNISNNPSSNYIQTADIDASATASWNSGAGFLPIPIFYGQYEGNGFTITNLTINRPETNYVGVFAQNRGVVNEMSIADSSFSGNYYTGSIAGFNSGTIYRSKSYRLNDSSNQVVGSYYTGGLVGYNGTVGTISESYVVSNVSGKPTGTRYVGGLVGTNVGSISNCYARGSVSGSGYRGGFVGRNTGLISNSLSTASVTTAPFNGGFGGHGTVNVSNSFWDINSSGYASSYGGIGTTTQALKTLSIFTNAGWNFDGIWGINSYNNDNYPHLLFDAVGFVDPNFTLIINRIGQGSVLVNGEIYLSPLSFSPGTNVLLSIANTLGWIFEKWEDDSTDSNRSLTINEDKTLTANFIEEGSGDDEGEGDDGSEDGESTPSGSSGSSGYYSPTIEDELSQMQVTSTRLEIGDRTLVIFWKNPTSTDFSGVIIRRLITAYPGVDQGIEVYRGLGNPDESGESSFFDSNLTNGETYYYSIFAYDSGGTVYLGSGVSGIPEASMLSASSTEEISAVKEQIEELVQEVAEDPIGQTKASSIAGIAITTSTVQSPEVPDTGQMKESSSSTIEELSAKNQQEKDTPSGNVDSNVGRDNLSVKSSVNKKSFNNSIISLTGQIFLFFLIILIILVLFWVYIKK